MRPTRPSLFDLVLAAVLAVIAVAEVLGTSAISGSRPVAVAATLAVTVPIAWRRVYPIPVAIVILVALGAAALAGASLMDGFMSAVILAFAIYAVARADVLDDELPDHTERAAQQERQRIARELHDVVAHRLSAIAVQAGAGMHVLHQHPEQARGAFEAIDGAARTGLAEMRRALGLLRSADAAAGLAPQPSLLDVERLAAESRNAGVPVDLRVDGDLHEVPAGLDMSAYRILQEALTNVRRHAPGARATVRVAADAGTLRLHVVDDGGGRSPTILDDDYTRTGHGLVGMRERVALYGGSLDTGKTPDGGFSVSATLPMDGIGA